MAIAHRGEGYRIVHRPAKRLPLAAVSLAGILFADAFAAPAGSQEAAKPPAAQQGSSLPAGAVARLGTPFPRHAEPMEFVGFAPDGRSFVSVAGDGARLWDPASGKEVRRFAGPGVRA